MSKKTTKQAGLKSQLVIEGNGLMTGFGRGNKATIEKRVENKQISTVAQKPKFDAEHGSGDKEKTYHIESKRGGQTLSGFSNDPLESKKIVGQDAIRCKDKLEKRYFGKTFNDNVHIQLIYNILDIEKILAVHANNIVYTLDNLRRADEDEHDDFIGYMSTTNDYKTFCEPERLLPDKDSHVWETINNSRAIFEEYLKNPRLHYFGETFYKKEKDPKTKKEKLVLRDDKDCYCVFAMLGGVRQFAMHDKNKVRHWLYDLDNFLDADSKRVLDGYYRSAIDGINDKFVENNTKTNFQILFNAYGLKMPGVATTAGAPASFGNSSLAAKLMAAGLGGAPTSDSAREDADAMEKRCLNMVKSFYAFTIQKSFKNIGFSIKKLREQLLLLPEYEYLKDTTYDSVRSKLYTLLDFVIYLDYKDKNFKKENLDKIDAMVDRLRASGSNDEAKEKIYIEEATRLKDVLKPTVKSIVTDLNKIHGGHSDDLEMADKTFQGKIALAIQNVSVSHDATLFTKLIYLMTMFLDGKEINDLLTTLIPLFESIDAFRDVMRAENIDCTFEEKFKFFENSRQVATELRVVNSFARMTKSSKDNAAAKFVMFREAAELLGASYTNEELTAYLNLDGTRKLASNPKKADTQFRNFIANNVIDSSRFRYLVRYSNPKKVRALINNPRLIEFTLGTLPTTQIERYCNVCGIALKDHEKENVKNLADAIVQLNLSDFEHVNQSANAEKNEDKAKKRGLISLYLTILYLFVKNLVYVNSRYTLAFHCLERDSQLHKISAGYNGSPYCAVTSRFIENEWLNQHARNYLQVNIGNGDDWAITKFRNNAAHLNCIRNIDTMLEGIKHFSSYFEIYQYAAQRCVAAYFEIDKEAGRITQTEDGANEFRYGDIRFVINPKTLTYMNLMEKNHGYCKDFVKALCAPFGYNLARFKNLSIDELFDRNDTRRRQKNAHTDYQVEKETC